MRKYTFMLFILIGLLPKIFFCQTSSDLGVPINEIVNDLGDYFPSNEGTNSHVSLNNGWARYWSNSENGTINDWEIRASDKFYVGDFDGNGAEELLQVQTGNTQGIILFSYENGDWNQKWSHYGNSHAMVPYKDNFIVGDFNGDNKDELLGNSPGWTTTFHFENGDWHWGWSDYGNHAIQPYKDNLISGDFDGNGKDEILGCDFDGWTTTFHFENGDFQWGWSDYGSDHAIRPYRQRLISADFDGDNKDEILGLGPSWATIFHFENNDFNWGWSTYGDNNFGGWTYPLVSSDRMLVGDINTNNKDEVMFIQTGNSASEAAVLNLMDNQNNWNWEWFADNQSSVPYIDDWPIGDNSLDNARYLLIKAEANHPEFLMAFRKNNDNTYLVNMYEFLLSIEPTANAGSNPAHICQGDTTPLDGSASSGNGLSYSWSPAIGLSSTTNSTPTASPNETTTYILTVTDANGNQDTDEVTVTVNPNPIVSAGADTTICEGESIMLNGSSSTGTLPFQYLWSPATGLSSTTNSSPTASPTITTNYILTITDYNTCEGTGEVTVNVNNLPTGIISGCEMACSNDGNTYFYDFNLSSGSIADDYQWTVTNADIISGPNTARLGIEFPNHVPNTATIELVVSNQGCVSEPITFNVELDDECVWPGNTKYDGDSEVNAADFNAFTVLTNGSTCPGIPVTGPARNNCASLLNYAWRPRPAENWASPSPFCSLLSWNAKHLDANGNGTLEREYSIPYQGLNPPPIVNPINCDPSDSNSCPLPPDFPLPDTDLDLIYYQIYRSFYLQSLTHDGNARNNPPKHIYIEPRLIENDNEKVTVILDLKIGEQDINTINDVTGINLKLDFGEGFLDNTNFNYYDEDTFLPFSFGAPNSHMLKMNFVHPREHHKTIIAIQKTDATSIDFAGQTFCRFYTEIPVDSLYDGDNQFTISVSDANLFFEDGSQLPVTAATKTIDWVEGEVVSLPIELLDFNAHTKNEMTYLNWTTATEQNNSHFNIQHSTNGKDWTTLGKVQGAGTSTEQQHYSWLHKQPNIGQNMYRLEQFDTNSSSTFSPIKIVKIEGEQTVITYQNPVKEELYVDINAQQDQVTSFALYNANGQLIEQRQIQLQEGAQTLTWKMGHLPKGLYLLKIIGEYSHVLKIVKG